VFLTHIDDTGEKPTGVYVVDCSWLFEFVKGLEEGTDLAETNTQNVLTVHVRLEDAETTCKVNIIEERSWKQY